MPLDPNVARLLAETAEKDPRGIEELTVAEARARGGSVAVGTVPFEDVRTVTDVSAGGIPARLYQPDARPPALLVYFHGGGWVVGSVDLSDHFCRALANASGCALLSVEYRLAPEHPYPAAPEDAYAATRWAEGHARELGVESGRIAVGGSSAGGNLAAVVSLIARERGGPRIALQWLHVPVTDHDFATESYRAYGTGHGLTLAGMRWFWDHYLPEVARRSEPHASPLRSSDFQHLPQALVLTAECDPLRSEGQAYAERLRDARVPVRYIEYPGMAHGFMSWSSVVPAARRAFDEIGAELRKAFF